MKKCPNCGSHKFIATAKLLVESQKSEVINRIQSIDETTELLPLNDVWECAECHYKAMAEEIEVK